MTTAIETQFKAGDKVKSESGFIGTVVEVQVNEGVVAEERVTVRWETKSRSKSLRRAAGLTKVEA